MPLCYIIYTVFGLVALHKIYECDPKRAKSHSVRQCMAMVTVTDMHETIPWHLFSSIRHKKNVQFNISHFGTNTVIKNPSNQDTTTCAERSVQSIQTTTNELTSK